MRRNCKNPYFVALLFGLCTGIIQGAHAYKIEKTVPIFGDPVAPPILDHDGFGFCAAIRQANYAESRLLSVDLLSLDAGSVLGNENSVTNPFYGKYPTYRYDTNFFSKGNSFIKYVNAFFDNSSPLFPQSVRGSVLSAPMNRKFDLSNAPHTMDPNGDFLHPTPLGPDCDAKGCPFPRLESGRNFDPNANAPTNQYKNALMKQMYPESDDSLDTIRNTASRFRGFLNVKQEWVNKTLAFAMYANDGAALVFADRTGKTYPIISVTSNRCEACTQNNTECKSKKMSSASTPDSSLPPQICSKPDPNKPGWCSGCFTRSTGERWRVEGRVRFSKPGLYPIEILHVQFTGNAALEVAMKVLAPEDTSTPVYENWGFPFESEIGGKNSYQTYPDSVSRPLSEQGFELLDPKFVFPSATGLPESCTQGQCGRISLEEPIPRPVCGQKEFCNEAGICEPCDANGKCGELCQPCVEPGKLVCGQVTSGEFSCVACNRNSDCGGKQTCNSKHQCECKTTFDCPQGQMCNAGQCVRGLTNDSCEGNSGQCCPPDTQCRPPNKNSTGEPWGCYQCNSYEQCAATQTCDPVNHQCVDKVPENNTPDKCGPRAIKCPPERPFCADGEVCIQCLIDTDCAGPGLLCLSGVCSPCNTDRKCGPGCHACSKDKPICDDRAGTDNAVCVTCYEDKHCGKNRRCSQSTGTCELTCSITCPPNLICDGDRCIQCVSNAQCACGQICNTETGECSAGCKFTEDCPANKCCGYETSECMPIRCVTRTTLNGGALCCDTNGSVEPPPSTPHTRRWVFSMLGALCILTLVVAFLRWRTRSQKKL